MDHKWNFSQVSGLWRCGECGLTASSLPLVGRSYTCSCEPSGSAQLPLQAALGDFAAQKKELDADRATLGVDPNSKPPFEFHTHVPMDEGWPECRQSVDRGFYRQYDAVWSETPAIPIEMPILVDPLDAQQIAWEIARESPVTGQVVFRLVGGRVVAQLVSYTAFA